MSPPVKNGTNVKSKIMEYKFSLNQGSNMPYDNNGAHAEVEKMMKRGEKLSVRFGTTKDRHPYAWVESRDVAGFKYLLDDKRLANLINYLDKGDVVEYAGDPMVSDILIDGEDFQFEMMKQFIEGGQRLQYTPQFREYRETISAMRQMFKGSIFFRIPRTKENLDFLREMKQPI